MINFNLFVRESFWRTLGYPSFNKKYWAHNLTTYKKLGVIT